jgi:hypothetical protein
MDELEGRDLVNGYGNTSSNPTTCSKLLLIYCKAAHPAGGTLHTTEAVHRASMHLNVSSSTCNCRNLLGFWLGNGCLSAFNRLLLLLVLV